MIFSKLDLDNAIIDANGAAVRKGQVVEPLRQADIVENELQILGRDDRPDLVLDLLKDLFGALDAGARRRPDMQLNEAGVDARKEIRADIERQRSGSDDDEERDRRGQEFASQDAGEKPGVEAAEAVEPPVESVMEPRQPVGRLAVLFMLLADQKPDHDRRQRARDAIGGEHGEHDGHGERREQIARRALQEKDGDEDAADGERRDQGRHGDAGGAFQHGLVEIHALFKQAVRVLDGDGRNRRRECRPPARGRRESWC